MDVGNLTVIEKGKDTKPVKKQLEVDFICNKGSKKYYIQSAYMLETEAKMAQEIYDNPQYKVLFDATKKLKPESIKEVMKFIDYQKAKEEGDLNE